jgi:hypothetical protein
MLDGTGEPGRCCGRPGAKIRPMAPEETPLERGHAALAGARWDRAREAFTAALEHEETPQALEGLAWAMWWLGDVRGSHVQLERAYAGYRQRGDLRHSARLATRLSRVYSLVYGTRRRPEDGSPARSACWTRPGRAPSADGSSSCASRGPLPRI